MSFRAVAAYTALLGTTSKTSELSCHQSIAVFHGSVAQLLGTPNKRQSANHEQLAQVPDYDCSKKKGRSSMSADMGSTRRNETSV